MSRPILSPLPGGDPAIYERARKASERASGLRDARDRAIDAIRRRLARLTRREIPPSILLVEDDEAIARSIRDALVEAMGARVVICTTGEEASAMIASTPNFSCIIIDLVLTRGAMTGLDLADRVPRTTLVAVTTGLDDGREIARAMKTQWFLPKPFDPEALRQFADDIRQELIEPS